MSTAELPSAQIRLRLGQEDAHYGGNLVAGATQLKIVGDLITERTSRWSSSRRSTPETGSRRPDGS